MIHVVWDERSAKRARNEGRDDVSHYVTELLRYSGFAVREWSPEEWAASTPSGVTVVAGLDRGRDWDALFRRYCENGNGILAVGDTFGLDGVLGANRQKRIYEGWIDWNRHRLADGLRGSFHFFGAALVKPGEGTECAGTVRLKNGTATDHPAYTYKTHGAGCAALFAVDLARTFWMIQQGVSVVKDGNPAPDGSAAIDDDILKTDDSIVLDWERDRTRTDDDSVPYFSEPILDEFRIVLTRVLHTIHEKIGKPAAQVWYWPEGLDAIGHISHDTDGNMVDAAHMTLDRLAEAGVRSTWCVIMPGYPDEVYEKVKAAGHEIALHYNALPAEGCSWDERLFNEQLDMLKRQVGSETAIMTNKNHYLRWEGDVQFYKWCERAGILVEQSKGGTKRGNKGFSAGTCHPYVPMSDAGEDNRLMNVVSIPTLAWDPPETMRCTKREALAIVDRCKDVNGVAHFLFHPTVIKINAAVGPFLVELVRYGRSLGLEWWTSDQLYRWYTARRGVETTVEGGRLRVSAKHACKGLTVLLPIRGERHSSPAQNGPVRRVRRVNRFGIDMWELVLDVEPGDTIVPVEGVFAPFAS